MKLWRCIQCTLLVAACSSEEASTAPPRSDASVGTEAGATSDAGSIDGATSTTDGGVSGDAAVKGPLFGFVGSSDGKIRVYDVNAASGAWTFKKESNGGNHPSFLAFDPSRRRVVAVDEASGSGLVRSFSFDPSSGALTEIDSETASGAGSTHVSIDPSGKWVFVANYTGGTMASLSLDPAGNLGAADTKTSGVKSHYAATNPSGTHVFVPALGEDHVAQYVLDSSNGKLTDNGVAALPSGAGPRHLAFHSSEKWAYVINELDVTVTTLTFASTTGKLTAKQTISALPNGQSASGVSGAEIAVHPNGNFVYGSTRSFNSIAVFAVDAAEGTLTLQQNAPTGADRPRSFTLDPEGTLLFAGNQDADEVVGFRIDPSTGALTALGKLIDVEGPTFVGMSRMP